MDQAQIYLCSRRGDTFSVTKSVRWKVERLQLDKIRNRDIIQKEVEHKQKADELQNAKAVLED